MKGREQKWEHALEAITLNEQLL